MNPNFWIDSKKKKKKSKQKQISTNILVENPKTQNKNKNKSNLNLFNKKTQLKGERMCRRQFLPPSVALP